MLSALADGAKRSSLRLSPALGSQEVAGKLLPRTQEVKVIEV
jgi:hypothetical protein